MLTLVLLPVLAALVAVNLVMTYGALRRLRDHARILQPGPGTTIEKVGEPVASFTATTVDGQVTSDAQVNPGTLVGFFMPGCAPCREKLPVFVRAAAGHPAGREGVLAVLVGSDQATADDVVSLAPVARVVVTSSDAEIVDAFGVRGYPSICTIGPDHRIASAQLTGSDPVAAGKAA